MSATNKSRLDRELVVRRLVATRSQAESYIKLGTVQVNGKVQAKPGAKVGASDDITMSSNQQYVSRAGLKLASVAALLNFNFIDKIVLDVGSSTGGFTDYALRHGASKVIAVDVGTNQLHPSLRDDHRVELHEKTDIRDFRLENTSYGTNGNASDSKIQNPNSIIDIVVIDVSFISLREVLPCVAKLSNPKTEIVAMAKPQFEAGAQAVNKGVIKNERIRRNTLKELEIWIQELFKIVSKADSQVAGAKGNLERFYLLRPLQKRS